MTERNIISITYVTKSGNIFTATQPTTLQVGDKVIVLHSYPAHKHVEYMCFGHISGIRADQTYDVALHKSRNSKVIIRCEKQHLHCININPSKFLLDELKLLPSANTNEAFDFNVKSFTKYDGLELMRARELATVLGNS